MLDRIREILISGSEDEIRRLEALGKAVELSYQYHPQESGLKDSFEVRLDREIVRGCGLGFTPRCVEIYGCSHVFGVE